jgi:hypothetical protein
MRKTTVGLAALAIAAALAAASSAQAQRLITLPVPYNNRVVADLWLRQMSNDQNLDGDHTTYWVTIYRKRGPQGEEHRIVGPRPVGEWRVGDGKGVGTDIADRLIQAHFRGDARYVIRITHGDGTVPLPNDPGIEYGLDAGNHIVAIVPEAMQCSDTAERQAGIYLKEPSHTWLWITVESPGLKTPEIATC